MNVSAEQSAAKEEGAAWHESSRSVTGAAAVTVGGTAAFSGTTPGPASGRVGTPQFHGDQSSRQCRRDASRSRIDRRCCHPAPRCSRTGRCGAVVDPPRDEGPPPLTEHPETVGTAMCVVPGARPVGSWGGAPFRAIGDVG
ncbi:unnamed protein product [Lampetra fluviatilis]